METPRERLKRVGIDIDLLDQTELLCKYYKVSDNADKVFTNSELWFSKPQAFNDPFDCQLQIDHEILDGNKILEFIRQTQPGMAVSQRLHIVNIYKSNPQEFIKINEWYFKELINNSGICCFSTKNNDILMWSHYGSCHTGYCLEFDWKSNFQFFNMPLPVNYKTDYPYINYFDDPEYFLALLFGTKSECWQYESEVRLYRLHQSGAMKFNKSCLKSIVFGAKCSDADKQHIKDLAAANSFNELIYKQASISSTAFKVEIT